MSGTSGSTTASFAFSYTNGTNWIHQVTSGSYKRVMPLRSSSPTSAKQDVIASATTTWGTTTLGSFTAAYTDVRGWRSGQTINTSSYATGLSLGGVAATYTYNGYGELTNSNSTLNARDLTWTFDLAGNRKTEVDPTGTTTYTADALNRYSSITGQRQEPGLAYDADGNLIQDAIWTYTYDAENRLKQMTKTGQTLTFTYDYLGRRIRKTVTGTGAYDIKFLWSGWTMIAELAANGTTANKTFVWGKDFSDAQGNAGGAGALLAQISGSTVSYAIPDVLGNIVAYANSSGTIVASVEYSPTGKGMNATGTWQSFPIGFAGQYMDWEPGIVYYGLRYYAPKHGRFINRDPIGEAGGNNLYRFVGNSSTRGWDVLGLWDWTTYIDEYWDSNGDYDNEPVQLPVFTTVGERETSEDVVNAYERDKYIESINATLRESGNELAEISSAGVPSVQGAASPAGSEKPAPNKKQAPLDLLKKLCGSKAGRALVDSLRNGDRTVREVASDQLSSSLQTATSMTAGTSNEAAGVIYLFPGNYANLANTLANSRFNYRGSASDFGASTLIHETLHFNNPAPPGPVPAGQAGRFEEALVRQLTDRALPSYNLPQIFGLPDRFQSYLGTVPNQGTDLRTGKPTSDYGQSANNSIMSQLDAASSELSGWDCSRVK